MEIELQSPIHTSCETHTVSYLLFIGGLFPGVKQPGREVEGHFHLDPELRVSGALKQLPNKSLCRGA
jgi:hypothetical protein